MPSVLYYQICSQRSRRRQAWPFSSAIAPCHSAGGLQLRGSSVWLLADWFWIVGLPYAPNPSWFSGHSWCSYCLPLSHLFPSSWMLLCFFAMVSLSSFLYFSWPSPDQGDFLFPKSYQPPKSCWYPLWSSWPCCCAVYDPLFLRRQWAALGRQLA